MKRKLGFITLAFLVLGSMALVSGPSAAHAAAFQVGDVFASTGPGTIQQWRSGVHIDTLHDGSKIGRASCRERV